MKTWRIISTFIMLFLSIILQAQTIDPDSDWRVDFHQSWFPGEFYNNLYRDYIDGDTVINSIQYYKVYHSGYSFYGIVPIGEVYTYDHVLHGYLREENSKWYTYFENNDALLFDFSLDVNDTVYSAYSYLTGDPIIVTAIDSILVDGDYKRRLQLNGWGAEYIIEGIGATSGLFENMFFFEWYSDLVCYAINGISVWGAITEECDLPVYINDNEDNSVQITMSPNPAHDYTVLYCPNILGGVTFKLANLFGVIVHQETIENQYSRRIQLSSISPGIYIAIIENNEISQSRKLIIK